MPTEPVIVHLDWADDSTGAPPLFQINLAAVEHVPAQVPSLADRFGPVAVSVVVMGTDLGAGETDAAPQVFALETALHNRRHRGPHRHRPARMDRPGPGAGNHAEPGADT